LDLHGKQKQHKRTTTFFEFCNAKTAILLCTDVAVSGPSARDSLRLGVSEAAAGARPRHSRCGLDYPVRPARRPARVRSPCRENCPGCRRLRWAVIMQQRVAVVGHYMRSCTHGDTVSTRTRCQAKRCCFYSLLSSDFYAI
jgi:superfamily II DNA/RNA helicase